ncbi:hypothetical protein [Agrococcus sp. DT81.2]|uniref:hypothetical protein n=1 Tax=Agrococcus sp. DT81.2 TaxID=3393414 RepID=UPI003CE4BA30
MIVASLALFIAMLRLVLGRALFMRRRRAVLVVSAIVVVLGMLFGKYGATALGLPWWIYYPVPALVTILLPPIVFRLPWRRTLLYLLLSTISAPLIHVLFSFLLGWNEYMPFIPIPSLASLLR